MRVLVLVVSVLVVAGLGVAGMVRLRGPVPLNASPGTGGPTVGRPASGVASASGARPVPSPAPHPSWAPGPDSVPPPKGTDAWRLTRPAEQGEIAGYATRISPEPGQAVSLRVSTTASRFRVEAYRIGWYRGGAARLVWRSRWHPGEVQAGPSYSDQARRTIVANWHDSTALRTAGWQPGAYLLKLVASTGWQSYVPLILRSPRTAGTVALVVPVATWQAYDDWGGYSLYTGRNGDHEAWAVSFDRPFRPPGGAGMLYGVLPVVVRAERLGIPLSYLSDLDLDADPHALTGARAYVSVGHDEYWTPRMREAVLQARDAGTNLAFLGADTEFWRIRLERSPTGPDRVVVGYRWFYAQDPMRSRHPALTTGPFGSAPDPQPEEALTGMRYECFPVDAPYVVESPGWWGFAGTGARRGRSFPHLVGIEADRVHPGPDTPRPLEVLSSAPYSCGGVRTSTQSVYYTTGSGAGVFNAGSLRWTCALDRRCGLPRISRATMRFARKVTDNVLTAFAQGPAGPSHPATDNLDRFSHLPGGHTAPAG